MIVPLLLLSCSVAGILLSLTVPDLAELLVVAAPAALASFYLFVKEWLGGPARRPEKTSERPARKTRGKNMIVLDGSNVMYWKDAEPRLSTLREVTKRLKRLGFKPGIVFDANAGYLLTGEYVGEKAFARKLGLPRDNVMVVHKGNPADPVLLSAARDLGARIVSNDRFRDWTAEHPEVNEPDHVIRGGYRDGRLWLGVDPE